MTKKRKIRIGPLNSLCACRTEMGKVYRLARNGEIEVDQLRAYVYCLRELRECLIASDIEQRLVALEEAEM